MIRLETYLARRVTRAEVILRCGVVIKLWLFCEPPDPHRFMQILGATRICAFSNHHGSKIYWIAGLSRSEK